MSRGLGATPYQGNRRQATSGFGLPRWRKGRQISLRIRERASTVNKSMKAFQRSARAILMAGRICQGIGIGHSLAWAYLPRRAAFGQSRRDRKWRI